MAISASGTSSAPGTLMWRMCLGETPATCNSAMQDCASLSVTGAFQRAWTMPMRKSRPSISTSLPLSASCIRLAFGSGVRGRCGCDEAGDFEAVAHHARHAPRAAQHSHFADAQVAKNLCADAIGAKVHLPALTLGALVVG